MKHKIKQLSMKRQIQKIVVVATLILATCTACAQKPKEKKNKWAPKQDITKLEKSWLTDCFAEKGTVIIQKKDTIVWGCAPIYDDQGKVHVYYSQWPVEGRDWVYDSRIMHAVADHPEGPYTLLEEALPPRPDKWDNGSIHNPSIYRIDGKYVLLYIGNTAYKDGKALDKKVVLGNNRVGMAISDSPYGPWKRFDKPMIDVSPNKKDWDSYCTVNPTMLKHPNGEYWLYYRGWDRLNDDRRKTGLAISKTLEGPYTKYEANPVIDFAEVGGQTEDPYIFYWKNRFHCLIRDMGNFDWYSGLYLSSKDGINWSSFKRSHYQGSHYFPVGPKCRYERVQVLRNPKTGAPEYIFNALMLNRTDKHVGACLKINMDKAKYPFE